MLVRLTLHESAPVPNQDGAAIVTESGHLSCSCQDISPFPFSETKNKTHNIMEKKESSITIQTSIVSSEPPTPPEPKQDAGLRAWLQVFACWLLFMNTWGLTNSFSIFETHYMHTFPHLSHSTISWIGSLQLFLTLFIGVFAGKAIDGGYVRTVVVTGIVFEVVGMLTTSFCREFWHVVLTQGVVVGMGSGMLAFTSAAIIPFYFVKRRMLAAGVVSTGSSVGESILLW